MSSGSIAVIVPTPKALCSTAVPTEREDTSKDGLGGAAGTAGADAGFAAADETAAAAFGGQPRVSVVTGKPPAEDAPQLPPAPQPEAPAEDALDQLLAFGEQFDNIVIQ